MLNALFRIDFVPFILPNSVYRDVPPQILADLQGQDVLQLCPRRECPHSQRPTPENYLLSRRPPSSSPSRVARTFSQTYLLFVDKTSSSCEIRSFQDPVPAREIPTLRYGAIDGPSGTARNRVP